MTNIVRPHRADMVSDIEEQPLDGVTQAPTISVVVRVWTGGERLLRSMDAITARQRDDSEIIIAAPKSGIAELMLERHGHVVEPTRATGGAMLAAGLRAASGLYVAYCDEGDIWEPDHLARLVEALEADSTLGLVHSVGRWVDVSGQAVPEPSFGGWESPWRPPPIRASQVVHHVEAARRVGGFDAWLDGFADADLWLRIGAWRPAAEIATTRVTLLAYPERDVATGGRREDRIRLTRHVRHLRWTARGKQSFPRRSSPPPFRAETWNPKESRRELVIQGSFRPDTSYGYVTRKLTEALERGGVAPILGAHVNDAPPEFQQFARPDAIDGRLALLYDTRYRPSSVSAERLAQYTMWESNLPPRRAIEEIEAAVGLVFVPCRQNADAFRDAGVRVPIRVLHHGVDPLEFPLLERPERETFTFGSFGDLTARKGIDVLMRAFRDEFRSGEPVRLRLKHGRGGRPAALPDVRIEHILSFLDHPALLEFLRSLDAYVLPSRGEGFGLTGLEAMATGLPLIATNWSGPAEYLDPTDSLPLRYRLVDAEGTESILTRFFGKWAEPDYEHLRMLLRWLYERRAEGRELGRLAAERVRREWTWDRAAHNLVRELDLFASDTSGQLD